MHADDGAGDRQFSEQIQVFTRVLRGGQYWVWIWLREVLAEQGLTAFDVAVAESAEQWRAEYGVIATRHGEVYEFRVSPGGDGELRRFEQWIDSPCRDKVLAAFRFLEAPSIEPGPEPPHG